MKRKIVVGLLLGAVGLSVTNCKDDLSSGSKSSNSELTTTATSTTLTAVAQTSGQLASGTSFTINGSTSDSSAIPPGGPGPRDHFPHSGGPLDGTSLLAPTNELLAIIDAESAGDIRGMQMHAAGGATVTNYNQSGAVVTLPLPPSGGPEGCSFSGGQFPQSDSALATIVKTVIDFGSGVTEKHDTTIITRSGEIIITRSGDAASRTEVITFVNYKVNGNSIEGTKTRVTTVTKANGTETGSSTTNVTGGKITFSDGTITAWTSTRQRNSSITFGSNSDQPVSGEITTTGSTAVTGSDGTLIYSHTITKTIIENIACGRTHHGPVSGTVEIVYRTNTIALDFGDGTCTSDTITITINGVTTTKTVGG